MDRPWICHTFSMGVILLSVYPGADFFLPGARHSNNAINFLTAPGKFLIAPPIFAFYLGRQGNNEHGENDNLYKKNIFL